MLAWLIAEKSHYFAGLIHLGLLLSRKAFSPSWPSSLTRMSAMRRTVSSITVLLITLWLTAKTSCLAAATAWGFAFALYLMVFSPWLVTARLDGKDG